MSDIRGITVCSSGSPIEINGPQAQTVRRSEKVHRVRQLLRELGGSAAKLHAVRNRKDSPNHQKARGQVHGNPWGGKKQVRTDLAAFERIDASGRRRSIKKKCERELGPHPHLPHQLSPEAAAA